MENQKNESESIRVRFDASRSDDIRKLAAAIRVSEVDIIGHSLELYLCIAQAFMRDPKSRVITEDSSGKLSELIGYELDILRLQKRT